MLQISVDEKEELRGGQYKRHHQPLTVKKWIVIFSFSPTG